MNRTSIARARPGELEARVVEAMRAGPFDVLTVAERIGSEPRYVRAVLRRLDEEGRLRRCGWTPKAAGQGKRQRQLFELVGGAS
jgi:hypothetical protein